MLAAPYLAAPAEGDLELAADQAIAACGGDAREAVKALIVANDFLETELARRGSRPRSNTAELRSGASTARDIAAEPRYRQHGEDLGVCQQFSPRTAGILRSSGYGIGENRVTVSQV
ncbi:hypothetical protein [Bradyrhizobium sp. WSM2793]|uniref:hypothetical protein n=1 Tax=Bradyrhizobium sp. WSM2793 TaxID=1038866 RepID=UPI000378A966|nr:hypothetical protein [Bradyrhizobium sp. WSM2793]